MSDNRKTVREYMAAILQNPKFFDWAARRYGEVRTSGEGLIPDVAVAPLAKAVEALDTALTEILPPDEGTDKRTN